MFVFVCETVCLLVYTFTAGVDRDLCVCDLCVGNVMPQRFLGVCMCVFVCVCVYTDRLFSSYVCGHCM